MIISKAQILNSADHVELLDASISKQLNITLRITFADFMKFCKERGIHTVYCDYKYYDEDYYLVSNEILEQYTSNKKERDFCEKWAEETNATIHSKDFSRPFSLTLACVVDSQLIGWEDTDYWMPQDAPSGKEALIVFIEAHEDEINDLYEDDREFELTLYDELRNTLLADSGFRCSTTISSRKQYARVFFSKNENKKYRGLLRKANYSWEREEQFRDIVNRIYEEYRNQCKQLKLHIGDPLPCDEADNN